MKTRLISMTLILTMLFSLCTYVTAQESPKAEPVVETNQTVDGFLCHRDGDVPATSSAMDGITPPITALVMCMMEQNLVYDQNDDSLIWNGLYYMLSLYGGLDARAQMTDDTLILPDEAVQDYAAALFYGLDAVPNLPEAMAERVTHEDGHYYLARGDAGQVDITLGTETQQADGALLVEGALVRTADDTSLCTFLVKLQPNDSMFDYAIDEILIQN